MNDQKSVDKWLSLVPWRTHNGEAFGLKMMPCNENEWSVSYYSHFSPNYDDRIGVIVRGTLSDCLAEVYRKITEEHPEMMPKVHKIPWKVLAMQIFRTEPEPKTSMDILSKVLGIEELKCTPVRRKHMMALSLVLHRLVADGSIEAVKTGKWFRYKLKTEVKASKPVHTPWQNDHSRFDYE